MKQESEGERYSCCSAALPGGPLAVYSTAWECVRMIRYDSCSEISGTPWDELDSEECKANVHRASDGENDDGGSAPARPAAAGDHCAFG